MGLLGKTKLSPEEIEEIEAIMRTKGISRPEGDLNAVLSEEQISTLKKAIQEGRKLRYIFIQEVRSLNPELEDATEEEIIEAFKRGYIEAPPGFDPGMFEIV